MTTSDAIVLALVAFAITLLLLTGDVLADRQPWIVKRS